MTTAQNESRQRFTMTASLLSGEGGTPRNPLALLFSIAPPASRTSVRKPIICNNLHNTHRNHRRATTSSASRPSGASFVHQPCTSYAPAQTAVS